MNNPYENPFDERRDEFTFYDDIAYKDAKRTVSRTCLGTALFSAVPYALILVLSLILVAIMGELAYTELVSNPYFNVGVSYGIMYLVGIPLLLLCIRGLPKRRLHDASSLSGGELIAMIPLAQFFMTAGANVGNVIDSIFVVLSGSETENPVESMASDMPIWLFALVTVVIAPIAEELIFRKLLFDRLSIHGNVFAIIFTSVLFGLIHGNFYQLFYAAFLGLLLGYVRVKGGSWLYAVGLHAFVNLFNGLIPTLLDGFTDGFEAALEALISGNAEVFAENIHAFMIFGSYIILQSLLSLAGTVIFIVALVKRKIHLKNAPECPLPHGRLPAVIFKSVGAIILLAVSTLIIFINYIPQ